MISVAKWKTPLKKWDNQVWMPVWILPSVHLAEREFWHLGTCCVCPVQAEGGSRETTWTASILVCFLLRAGVAQFEYFKRKWKLEVISFILLNLRIIRKKIKIAWFGFLLVSVSSLLQMLQRCWAIIFVGFVVPLRSEKQMRSGLSSYDVICVFIEKQMLQWVSK